MDLDFKGAIFDLDETLIETISVWKRLNTDLLLRYNAVCTDEVMEKLNTLSVLKSVEYLIQTYNIPKTTDELIYEINHMVYSEYANNIPFKDSALDYLKHLKVKGIKLAIATTNERSLTEAVLKNNQALELFDCIFCADEEQTDKNSPEIYIKAAEKLDLKPCDCVVFEDLYEGILSAKRGGFRVVGVLNESPWYEKDKIVKASDFCIERFGDLLMKHDL